MRIFKNHADDLSVAGWQLCFETLLMKIVGEDAARHKAAETEARPAEVLAALDATSKTLLEDVAVLISENLDPIASSSSFDRLWSEMLQIFQGYLGCASAVVIAANYTATTTLLRKLTPFDQRWKAAIKEGALVWSSGIPNVKGQSAEQEAFLAYAACAVEIYRLTKNSSQADDLNTMALDLYECVCASSGGVHGMDAHNMTPLQSKVLECLKMLRTNIDSVASTIIKIASTFVRLPFDDPSQTKPRTDLTFVALSKASTDWLVELLTSHIANEEVYTSNSVARSLESLVIPIKRKYTWKTNGKGPAPWQKAVPAALSIIEPALHQMTTLSLSEETKIRVWRSIIRVAHEIAHADLDVKPPPALDVIENDEITDCDSLVRLRQMVIPRLGATSLPDGLRNTFVSSMFHASIVHAPEHNDIPPPETPPLTDLHSIRLGRVRDPPPTPRESMAYLCFNELISLTSKPVHGVECREERIKLAQAAAPWLILRLAIPLKAYIADQPLRGSLPMPLSQVEELEFCLKSMGELVCDAQALEDGDRRGGEKAHLRWLYPLVVKAVAVAGDKRHGSGKVLAGLIRVLDVAGSEL